MVAVRQKKRDKYDRLTFNRFLGRVVHNFMSTRARLVEESKSHIDPPGRDLDYECGYPDSPDVPTFRRLYDREGYAKRVVDVWPDECWAVRPELYETEESRVTKFERAWAKLNKRVNVWHYLHRADRLSGIGGFGVLLLGLDDGKPLDRPVAGIDRRGEVSKKRPKRDLNLIYLKAFSEECVEISEIETDRSNPRYGQPRFYEIDVASPNTKHSSVQETIRVHWTRIVHVADNREESDVIGIPRMRPVLNRLLDIRKTLGGSAEMFWKGAFPGYSFETVPELLGESSMNEATIREQFEEYMEGLKRYIALDGATVKQLFPQVADPTKHVTEQVTAVCATIGIPLRIFLGSEAGHLASTQDAGTWNKRVAQRQNLYVEPMLIRPFVDRLIMIGVLPEPQDMEYIVSWKDLNTMSDRDKADVSLKRAQALMQYVSGNVESMFPAREFYTLILGLTATEADAVIGAVGKQKRLTPPPPPPGAAGGNGKPRPQGGGRSGSPPRGTSRAGRPAGRIQRNRAALAA